MQMDRVVDVLVIGGGPAGSTISMLLRDKGYTPLIVERAEFPRYHIGESMTAEAGAIVRSLGLGDEMNAAGHQIKHGVSVFGTRGHQDWWIPVMNRKGDGVLRDDTTWQVKRSVFDKMLLDKAVAKGVELLHGKATDPIVDEDGRVLGVTVTTPDGAQLSIGSDLTLDCTGQATFLANKKITGPKYLGSYDKQLAVFSQIGDYQRGGGGEDRIQQPGNTHIFYAKKYHWAWAIPIEDDITSVGIVVPAEYFRGKGESREEFVSREMHELNDGLAERVPVGELVEPARTIPNYSFQVSDFGGPGFLCVGDAHRFIDPIFSFGLFIALREATMAAEAAARYLEGEGRDSADPFRAHIDETEHALDILEDVLDTFWENPLAFAYLVHNRYRDPLIDVFSGRIYSDMPTDERFDEALGTFRRLLERDRQVEDTDLSSVPIGSRFHPERAPLWDTKLATVESTEAWLRDVV